VLWKKAKPGEPSWGSPWGNGRPGWHIECSAMSTKCLGNTFDIHGGGSDLQFPHHENERAQSEGSTGQRFANTWMHVGFVQINNEKMSKSLDNFFTIRDVIKLYDPEAIRYFMIASHYRSPVNYSQKQLDNANDALCRFYTALRDLEPSTPPNVSKFRDRFIQAMDDDFNTPVALSVMFDLVKEINRLRKFHQIQAQSHAALLKEFGSVLGLLEQAPEIYLQGNIDSSHEQIEHLIELRLIARREKDWARADQIRDQLLSMGILLEDTTTGSSWRKK